MSKKCRKKSVCAVVVMVYYLVADIGMPVVIADVFDGISFITGFGCEKFVNQEV